MTTTKEQTNTEKLHAILHRANRGDTNALTELRTFLDENPNVWAHVGDLARVAEHALIAMISNGGALTTEAIKRQLAELRAGLLDDGDSVTDRMLADVVVATWLEVHYLRSIEANNKQRSASQANILTKRYESAQRRHLAAIKERALIRKLIPNRKSLPDLRVFRAKEKTA